MVDRHSLIEDEVFAIRQSGEMPEVALHSARYFLEEDSQGPGLRLTPEEEQLIGRYRVYMEAESIEVTPYSPEQRPGG